MIGFFREELQFKFEQDLLRESPKILKDSNGTEFHFDTKRRLFVGMFEGKEWVMGINSRVPGFWHYCPHPTNNLKCAAPHFVLIYEDGDIIKCQRCGRQSTITLSSPMLDIQAMIDRLREERNASR